ncbi:natterin-3-like [Astyanax mexicanus]|uniref:natterin-3-like n=1 Tax=Astyanax mexicanus TaxID=7994 RepID=UPI0020CAF6CA|nr:natterin-3-like [Astyanax mexicanus]
MLKFSQAGPILTTAWIVQQDEQEMIQTASPPDDSPHITPSTSNNTGEPQLRQSNPRSQRRGQRSGPQRPVYEEFPSLKWVRWSGTLPRWAVKVKNERTKRLDYVCAPVTGCNWAVGYYNTGRDAVCRSSCHGKEQKSSTFDVLVNENSAVNLEWVKVSEDAFPPNPVHISTENAVGRSSHGVGTFYMPFTQFYVPWQGTETVLSEGFEVLVMTGEYSQHIYDVLYDIDKLSMESKDSVIVTSTSVTNNGDVILKKTVNLAKSIQQQNTWQTTDSTSLSITSSITAGVMLFFSATYGFSFEKKFTNMNTNSVTETDAHSLTLEIDIPPKYTCQVKMVGEQYKASIPFTAKQQRIYDNGDERTTMITGVYHGTQVGEIKAVAEKCVPIEGEQLFNYH